MERDLSRRIMVILFVLFCILLGPLVLLSLDVAIVFSFVVLVIFSVLVVQDLYRTYRTAQQNWLEENTQSVLSPQEWIIVVVGIAIASVSEVFIQKQLSELMGDILSFVLSLSIWGVIIFVTFRVVLSISNKRKKDNTETSTALSDE